jgi:hypothetical protein
MDDSFEWGFPGAALLSKLDPQGLSRISIPWNLTLDQVAPLILLRL